MAYELIETPQSEGRYEFVGPAPAPLKLGQEGMPEAIAATAKEYPKLTQAAVGAKALWDLSAMRLKQAAGLDLTPQDQEDIRNNRALLGSSGPAMAGAAVPAIGLGMMTAPATGLAVRGMGLPAILQPTAQAALTGGLVNAATTPTLPGESQSAPMTAGAIGGAAADALLRGGSRLVQPILQSQPVKNLLSQGVVPTIGQAIGGAANRLEEKLYSVPVLGDVIGYARNRARNEMGTAAINLQMPNGLKATQPGNAGVEQADDLLSGAYQRLYGNTQVSRDAQLVSDLRNAVNTPSIPLSNEYRKMYDKIIARDVLDRLQSGQSFSSAEVKAEIEGDLGKAIRALGPKGQEGSLRDALFSARQAVRDLAARQAGISQPERQTLDRAYANLRDVGKAAERAEANGGVPTPLQLIQAAKDGSKLEQFGRDAQAVMGNRVPNSGTTDRMLMAMLVGGAGAGASQTNAYQETPYLNSLGPGFWLSLGASPLLYSRLGTQYMLGDNAIQPALAAAMRGMSPAAAPVGALYLQNKQ